tara:strand:+ start:9071 stop:9871 length:801 start_codon:yes stop_codon:yes gene_type:complete
MEDIKQHTKYLKSHGFTILENFLNKEEIIHYKELIDTYFAGGKNRCIGYTKSPTSTLKPDGINNPHFEPMKGIFSNPRLIEVIKKITDNKIRYVHHFDIHLNMPGAKGWHSDVQNIYYDGGKHYTKDKGGVWEEEGEKYGIYRIAIYLQDHINGGGFSVIPASHSIPENEDKLYNNINIDQFESPFHIPSKAGDCIIFDARLLHKGEQYNGDRYAIFTAIGADNGHSKGHARGAIDRQIRQNLQGEYILQPYMKNLLEDLNIKYDY